MEDVKENSKEKPEYLEKERFTQKYDDIEKMKESRSIKEMTNEEFLSQFKNLPEIPEFKKLLIEYKGIFATSEKDMEQVPREVAEFSIPFKTDKEGNVMQPKDMDISGEEKKDPNVQESLSKWLQNQMKAGYILKVEKGNKLGIERVEFACNLIHVEKKGKKELRHCQNMKRVNECTIPRSQRIGYLEAQLKNAMGYKCYSAMDIRMGFNNLWIKKEDVYKTAFKCIYGIYVQLVMGFGYKDAPTEFQETMEKIFDEVIFERFISIYMDDILIKTNTKEEMIQRLRQVFELMKKGRIKADTSKCEFFKKEIKILGKLVSEKGIRIPDAYQEAIEKWKYPEGLESYNGRITWMMDFVPDAQEDLARIRKIINSEVPLNDKIAREAFENLKKKIKKRIILVKPDYNKIMKLSCDAGPEALGACLYQEEINEKKKTKNIIGFYSKSLNKLQKGYSIPRLELMAINEGIDHFYADLRLSKGIQILTDSEIAYKLHRSVLTKDKITESPKFLPLLIKHMELEKEIIWIKRENNKWADLMTRIGLSAEKQIEEQRDKLNKEKIELTILENQELYPNGPRLRNQKDINNINNIINQKRLEINNRKEITNRKREICQQESKNYKRRKKSISQNHGRIPKKTKKKRNT